ncbi:anthranilate synthase component I [candidate division KSB1 bacterium]
MVIPGFEEFKKSAKAGTVMPVYEPVAGDLLTPVAAFLKIGADSDYAFLLESIEGGEHIARYTFLGADPYLVVTCAEDEAVLYRPAIDEKETVPGNPIDVLRREINRYHAEPIPDLPRFTGGAVGYVSYDTVRLVEKLPGNEVDPLDTPLGTFMFYDTFLVFDHLKHRILIVSGAFVDDPARVDGPYRAARERIKHLKSRLAAPLVQPSYEPVKAPEVRSNFSREDFENSVRRAKDYITAGDIFQVVLSQRFQVDPAPDPFLTYRALRMVNPSPYLYYLSMGDIHIIGSSPEMLVRVEGDTLENRPIAGTRPRGSDEEADARLEADLRTDEKEKAEHLMLVDLGRNDVGRVSRAGTVKVASFMEVEKYSHVMHLVSAVEGRLREGMDSFDALLSCFPAGTVSGAPKVRAMEIIDELEPHKRGIYAGAVGYHDFSGNLDSCITIRTIVVKDGVASVQVGAGIVADSDPASEYDETVSKGRGMQRALEMAASGSIG